MASGPAFIRFFWPLIQALRELGGSAPPREAVDLVVEKLGITDEERAERLKGGSLRVDNAVHWARNYLVWAGLLDGSKRGLWQLSASGWSLPLERQDRATALELFKRMRSEHIGAPGQGVPEEEGTDPEDPPKLSEAEVRTEEVVQELDAKGRGAGVEHEAIYEELEDTILDPFDPRLIDVTTETRTLDTLVKRLSIHEIDLDPEFQRLRDIWPIQKKGQLIESLLLRIPLPTFYVAEIDIPGELGSDQWAVVDGIQRLSTIAEFVAPEIVGLKPLRLKGLQYLRALEGKTFMELSQSMQLRILESQFTIQVIRKSTPELVRDNIFARINTGGLPLTPQELRHALTPGPARGLLKEMAELEVFKQAVNYSVSPSRMADREMVLRYLAFRMEDPLSYRAKDFDAFLRTCMKRINAWGDDERIRALGEFSLVMKACREVFGREAFRKRYRVEDSRRPVSKALFEGESVAVAAVISDPELSVAALISRADEVQSEFMDLMRDVEFDRAISQGTGDPAKVRYRFRKLTDLMTSLALP